MWLWNRIIITAHSVAYCSTETSFRTGIYLAQRFTLSPTEHQVALLGRSVSEKLKMKPNEMEETCQQPARSRPVLIHRKERTGYDLNSCERGTAGQECVLVQTNKGWCTGHPHLPNLVFSSPFTEHTNRTVFCQRDTHTEGRTVTAQTRKPSRQGETYTFLLFLKNSALPLSLTPVSSRLVWKLPGTQIMSLAPTSEVQKNKEEPHGFLALSGWNG